MREEEPAGVLRHPLIRELVALGLPAEDYVIFGSGPLLAHGIRTELGDLDLVARGAAWQRAERTGTPCRGAVTGGPGYQFDGGRITVFPNWISPDWDTDDLIDRAEVVDGLRFARLQDVLAYKRQLRRPKDVVDIRTIMRFVTEQR